MFATRCVVLRGMDSAGSPRGRAKASLLALAAATSLLCALQAGAQVLQDDRTPGIPNEVSTPPGYRQGNVHNPFSPGYNPMTPGNFDRRNNPPVAVPLPGNAGGGFSGGGFGGYVPYNPYGYGQVPGGYTYYGGGYVTSPYGYNPYAGNGYNNYGNYGYNQYGYRGTPYGGYGYRQYGSTTVTVVPGPQYGPDFTAPQGNAGPSRQPRARNRFDGDVSTDNTRDLARKFIKLGDTYFGDQKYRDAIKRYDRAIQAAPQLADAFFRKGHTRMALKQYEQAAEAFRQGLSADPDWPSRPDNLVQLYGDNRLARQAHLAALQDAVRRDPNNADLLFVLGVELYCSGQVHQAHQALTEASRLTRQAPHIELFLEATDQLVRRGDDGDHEPPPQDLPPRNRRDRREQDPEVDL